MRPTTSFRQTVCTLIQRYWIGLTTIALIALVLLLGSPAWAAPVASPANQTVPEPTPTSSNEPVPTATPLPDDDNDNNGSSGSDQSAQPSAGSQELQQGNIDDIIFGQSDTEGAATGPAYSAIISVATLNVREGPGTDFNIVGSVAGDEEVTVLFRNDNNSWWYVCCVTNTTTRGWISSQLAEPTFDRAQSADLLPVFGEEETAAVIASAGPSASDTEASEASSAPNQAGAQLPLELSVSHSPDYVWQGRQVDIGLTISNPNDVSITGVSVSDELPAQLEFIDADATSQGRVSQEPTTSGTVLVRIRWNSIPAGGAVSATISTRVSSDVPNGAVIDNLAAVRAQNAAYSSSGVSIGMPPVGIPTFQ